MLAVITDDFTGASEIAGVALAKGYRTVIETRPVRRPDADVIVIATDMRSLAAADAANLSAKLTEQILAFKPDFIFKKVDSVLRGNIGPELEAQIHIERKSAALLVPANPSRKRTIANGIYYVDNMPVAESGFSQNRSAFPSSSRVIDILESRGASMVTCVSLDDSLKAPGVLVGNAASNEDLSAWATHIDDRLVPAGAADFFAAILDCRPAPQRINGAQVSTAIGTRTLYLCGSNYPSSREAVAIAGNHGASIVGMPDEIYYGDKVNSDAVRVWARNVESALFKGHTVVVAALQIQQGDCLSGRQITAAMAEVAGYVVRRNAVDELMIEGGATSQAVMDTLQIDHLYPSDAVAPGVTRMRVDNYPDLHITMKPGSYRWPDKIWNAK